MIVPLVRRGPRLKSERRHHNSPPRSPDVLAISARLRHIRAMSGFEPTDYSVVVKNRGNPPDPWRWEIYRAGRSSAIKQSSVYFHTMAMASRAGKEALKGLLEKLYA
jgi:hypothetical protein